MRRNICYTKNVLHFNEVARENIFNVSEPARKMILHERDNFLVKLAYYNNIKEYLDKSRGTVQ